ncbi:hypothetical protein ACCT28_36880, partial [Rhizobium ruizarguesonis]
KFVRCLAHDRSTFSEVGASGKPGAVHYFGTSGENSRGIDTGTAHDHGSNSPCRATYDFNKSIVV